MLDDKHQAGVALPVNVPFLVLDENRLALTALNGLRNRTRRGARLVYVYGPSGNGKSHLARQFVRDERRHSPRAQIAHVTGAQFAAELAEASKAKTIPEFQRRYRDLDVFVCEDIQALEGRWESQRQLIFALDEVLGAGGRCLFTARKSPGELINVFQRLVNRCRGGVTAAVKSPGQQARADLVMHFAQTQQIPISEEAGRTLSKELPVSPRELLATVLQLDAWARMDGSAVDDRFVRRYLDGEVKPAAITLDQISRAVAKHFDMSLKKLRSGTRTQGEVLPRQCAMWLARQLTREPLRAIAGFFGRKNHATVVHACGRLKRLTRSDAAVRQHLAQIRHELTIFSGG
jgi:chromosomal replication initiator protein